MVQNTFYKVRARLESIFQRGKKDMKMDKLNIDVSRDPWSSTHVVLGDLKEVYVNCQLFYEFQMVLNMSE